MSTTLNGTNSFSTKTDLTIVQRVANVDMRVICLVCHSETSLADDIYIVFFSLLVLLYLLIIAFSCYH